jgi:hypothetical protein
MPSQLYRASNTRPPYVHLSKTNEACEIAQCLHFVDYVERESFTVSPIVKDKIKIYVSSS